MSSKKDIKVQDTKSSVSQNGEGKSSETKPAHSEAKDTERKSPEDGDNLTTAATGATGGAEGVSSSRQEVDDFAAKTKALVDSLQDTRNTFAEFDRLGDSLKTALAPLALNLASSYGMVAPQPTGPGPSYDLEKFREVVKKSRHVVVLTGAGVSAESGVPTYRGVGKMNKWRGRTPQELATNEAFESDPSLLWEYYGYKRGIMLGKAPNAAHKALADYEKRLQQQGGRLVIVTQNIDNLHALAGSQHIIELHGNMFKTRCTKCCKIEMNTSDPLCEALKDKGLPDGEGAKIPEEQLPRCGVKSCGGLLRPHVVWFGENLERPVVDAAEKELEACDLCLVVGTSSNVYPAASFGPTCAVRGVPVAEFNIEETSTTANFSYFIKGPVGTTLPQALAP